MPGAAAADWPKTGVELAFHINGDAISCKNCMMRRVRRRGDLFFSFFLNSPVAIVPTTTHVVLTRPPLANEKLRPHAAMRLFLQTAAGPLKDDMDALTGRPSLFFGRGAN